MKKIVLFALLLSLFNTSFASNDVINGLKNIPIDFNSECYQYHKIVNDSLFKKGFTYYLKTNKSDILVTQNNKVLPTKLSYQKDGVYNDYILNGDKDFDYRNLKDGNNKTFFEFTIGLDEKSGKNLVLVFDEGVREYSTSFNFSFKSDNYTAKYYISKNGDEYDRVSMSNITDFSFKYLKIEFVAKYKFDTDTDFAEKIKIYELSFLKNISGFLFMSFFDDDINIYSSNNCKDKVNIFANPFYAFSTDTNTKTVEVYLTKNSKYNVFVGKDVDYDRVPDEEDNCKTIYNPRQLDSNADGKGDLCSDDDRDGIIGNKDNCKYVANSDQKDVNRNGVGDVCEFDKDEDGIFDRLDNCINDANADQKDDDKDKIGNVCDNCDIYNPRQLDKDNSGIGDVCEQKQQHLLENDKDKDKILDSVDNCKEVSNPDQKDTDKDGVGNVCDNCSNIQNTNQLDFNENGVGDMCEDSDDDGIDGLVDNCINVSNPDQKDSDNNGIGDVCEDGDNDNIISNEDNCPYDYNPEQKDTDDDKIGDKCDDKDDRYIESNRNIFIGFMVLVTLMFFGGISLMLKKLGNSKIDDK